MDFSSRNEDAPKPREFPKHLPTHEPPDSFFTNAQLRCAALYVERLTFEGCCGYCIHNFCFASQQHTTRRNTFGVAGTQSVIFQNGWWMKASVSCSAGLVGLLGLEPRTKAL